MDRPKIYNHYIGIYVKEDMFNALVRLAAKEGLKGRDKNVLGEKLKQPKMGISILIRRVLEDYINRS